MDFTLQIAASAVVATVVGWFVVHHLNTSRDTESARRERDRKLLDELLAAHPVSAVRVAVQGNDTDYLRALLDEWSEPERRFVLSPLARSWRRVERALRNSCASANGDRYTTRLYMLFGVPLVYEYSNVPMDPKKRRKFYLISKEAQPREVREADLALPDRQLVPVAQGWSEGANRRLNRY